MAKKELDMDEIDPGFIISSFKTSGKPKAPATTGEEKKGTDEPNLPQTQPEKKNQPIQNKRLVGYGEKYLKRNELKTRQCVYISQQVHSVISRLVHIIADKDITVGGYIDTVLMEHLEKHKDEINEMYRQKREDLL